MTLATALYHEDKYSIERVHELTKIDHCFVHRMRNIVALHVRLEKLRLSEADRALTFAAKRAGFSDIRTAKAVARCVLSIHAPIKQCKNVYSVEGAVRLHRIELGALPRVKQIDTVAAEYPAHTNYLYMTYMSEPRHEVDFEPSGIDDSNSTPRMSLLSVEQGAPAAVLGSGAYRIGSSVEFDACAVACVKELRQLHYRTTMANCNPETVSTDYDMCDRLYSEELSLEVAVHV